MSKLLRNPETRWFFVSFVLTFAALATAFLLQAANGPVRIEAPTRTPAHTAGAFTFSTPLQLAGKPLSPAFFQADGEPEIKSDLFGNIYVTAINGVPGGVDLWKSIDKGATVPLPGSTGRLAGPLHSGHTAMFGRGRRG